MSERNIPFRDLDEERVLFGSLDRNLHLLRRLFKVDAVSRGGTLRITGDPDATEKAATAIEEALGIIRSGRPHDAGDIEQTIRRGGGGSPERGPKGSQASEDDFEGIRPPVEPRTENQARYLEAINRATVAFGVGPAGTGKSFLAVAMAVAFLKHGTFRRIILCRPAVEAGENLGFLPGDMTQKITPYLRPLYDALHALMPRAQLDRYLEEGVVEILPLAYMRGRTLDHALIILDEAQNCTDGQMKMALTRIGRQSKMVITGDVTQIDLPPRSTSGLVTARHILDGLPGIEFVYFNKLDIVRHPVVAEIVRAYGRHDERLRDGARERIGQSAEGDAAGRGPRSDKGRRRP